MGYCLTTTEVALTLLTEEDEIINMDESPNNSVQNEDADDFFSR